MTKRPESGPIWATRSNEPAHAGLLLSWDPPCRKASPDSLASFHFPFLRPNEGGRNSPSVFLPLTAASHADERNFLGTLLSSPGRADP